MIVCVSISETLCRSVFVRIPDGSSTTDAANLVRNKHNNGEIVLDADDFVCDSGEVFESYTETNEEFKGRVDYGIV